MEDQSRSSASREHRESVGAPARLSASGDDDLAVVVTPSPGSIDPTAANDSTPIDDNTLQRPSSMHSRPSSIAKPLAPNHPRPRSNMLASEAGLQENLGISMQAEAPYEGPSNPSHPYQMYPQRAMSISTISSGTPVPDGPYAGSRGPTHPYSLYTQSAPTADVAQPDSIPVGFPGMTNVFPRRLGLPGDEAGSLVGSVEDLPPYTRYPDNGVAPKPAGPQQTTEDSSSREPQPIPGPRHASSSNIAPIPGAGGIGLATRDPEFASISSEPGSPRLSTRSLTSDGSHHDINTAAGAAASEKPTMKSWQEQATKKLWGIIPYWAVALLGVVLVLMGVILGAVIGTFLSKDRGPPRGRPDRPHFDDANSTQEVIPLQNVPDDLPDLEIGAWGLLPLTVSQAPSGCLEILEQSQAWTCNAPMSLYEVDVQSVDDAPPTSAFQLKFAPSKNSTTFTKYAWGARTPAVPEHETLRLVRDPSEPGLGPAWWVRRVYNKTVVLPEDRISPSVEPSDRRRRIHPSDVVLAFAKRGEGEDASDESKDDDDSKEKPGQPFPFPGAKDGDKAWICTWPDTVLEVFVYPRQNTTFNTHATESFSGSPEPTKPPTSTTELAAREVTPTEPPDVAEVEESASPTGGPSDPEWARHKFPPLPPPYPQVVKVSERRVDGLADAGAYCEQVEIIEGGKGHRPVLDAEGRPVRVEVPEQRGPPPGEGGSWARADELEGRDKPPGDCGCVWMVE